MTNQPNNVSAAGVLSDLPELPRCFTWSDEHARRLWDEEGMREYARASIAAASAQAKGQAWLTNEQREAVEYAADLIDEKWGEPMKGAAVLRGILSATGQGQDDCKCRRLGDWKGFHHPLCDAAAPSPAAREAGDGVALTDAQREELSLIERCNPDLLLMHIEQDTNYDAKLLARVFDLAKEQSRALLREAGSR